MLSPTRAEDGCGSKQRKDEYASAHSWMISERLGTFLRHPGVSGGCDESGFDFLTKIGLMKPPPRRFTDKHRPRLSERLPFPSLACWCWFHSGDRN